MWKLCYFSQVVSCKLNLLVCTGNYQFIHVLRDMLYIRSGINIPSLKACLWMFAWKYISWFEKVITRLYCWQYHEKRQELNIKRTLIILHLAIGRVINFFPSTNTYSNTNAPRKGTFRRASYFSFPYHNHSRRHKNFMTNRIYANEISKIFYCNFKYILSKYFLSTGRIYHFIR